MAPPDLSGGCTCGGVRYRLAAPPLIVHCCHCRWCQRESGSAFVVNAVIETTRVTLLAGSPVIVHTPSASGKGQRITRCPDCHVALWSHYADSGATIAFVRAGTLDEPARLPPDIHIFTASMLPWVRLPEGARAVPEYYHLPDVWTPEALARRAAARGR